MESIQGFAYKTSTDLSFDDAINKVTELLKGQGFGVLTEIDVKATLKKKIDVDYKPYKILGACNPPFAHQALEAEPMIGNLLPCNFAIYDEGDKRVISAMNPMIMAQISDNEKIQQLAGDVNEKIKTVFAGLE